MAYTPESRGYRNARRYALCTIHEQGLFCLAYNCGALYIALETHSSPTALYGKTTYLGLIP